MKSVAPVGAANNVNLEMQRFYAGQNYREVPPGAAAAGPPPPSATPGPNWPTNYDPAHQGNLCFNQPLIFFPGTASFSNMLCRRLAIDRKYILVLNVFKFVHCKILYVKIELKCLLLVLHF